MIEMLRDKRFPENELHMFTVVVFNNPEITEDRTTRVDAVFGVESRERELARRLVGDYVEHHHPEFSGVGKKGIDRMIVFKGDPRNEGLEQYKNFLNTHREWIDVDFTLREYLKHFSREQLSEPGLLSKLV